MNRAGRLRRRRELLPVRERPKARPNRSTTPRVAAPAIYRSGSGGARARRGTRWAGSAERPAASSAARSAGSPEAEPRRPGRRATTRGGAFENQADAGDLAPGPDPRPLDRARRAAARPVPGETAVDSALRSIAERHRSGVPCSMIRQPARTPRIRVQRPLARARRRSPRRSPNGRKYLSTPGARAAPRMHMDRMNCGPAPPMIGGRSSGRSRRRPGQRPVVTAPPEPEPASFERAPSRLTLIWF